MQYLMLVNVIFLVAGMAMDVKAAVALFAPIVVLVVLVGTVMLQVVAAMPSPRRRPGRRSRRATP